VPFRDIAEAIGRQLSLPTASITAGEAVGHLGFLAAFVSSDNPTSSALTRERLGWQPECPHYSRTSKRVTISPTEPLLAAAWSSSRADP
jgi:hypothetical protein